MPCLPCTMLAFPEAVKHGGGTAFERAPGMNLYDYMYRAEELEYSAPMKSENVAFDIGTKSSFTSSIISNRPNFA